MNSFRFYVDCLVFVDQWSVILFQEIQAVGKLLLELILLLQKGKAYCLFSLVHCVTLITFINIQCTQIYSHLVSCWLSHVSLLWRVQKNFEGKLIGADRTKDLAVLKVILFLEHVNFQIWSC